MRTLTFCAVVIAASMFTMAVEYVYGWSKVGPHAEVAWGYADQLVTEVGEVIGVEARAENADAAEGAEGAEGAGAADSTRAGD